MSVDAPVFFTVGHSTRTLEAFVALLHAAGVRAVADVRRFPASRRHPQFNRENLDVSLPESVIVVEWGEGKVEELTDDRLHVQIHRAVGDTTDEVRHVTLTPVGERWAAADLSVLTA